MGSGADGPRQREGRGLVRAGRVAKAVHLEQLYSTRRRDVRRDARGNTKGGEPLEAAPLVVGLPARGSLHALTNAN